MDVEHDVAALVSDDDMVFGRQTDLGKLLATLETTSFDIVSRGWLDHDPWTGVRREFRHWEGTLDVHDRVLTHRYGATRVVNGPVLWWLRRASRVGERVVREQRLRAS